MTSLEPTLLFRKLGDDEFDEAHGVLVSAAEWLISKGVRQWTTDFPKESYREAQRLGWNYALTADDRLAVVLTLSYGVVADWADRLERRPIWWLSKVATAAEHRGRGFGAEAVRRVIEMAGERGAKRVYLDCVYNQGVLVDFYRRFGFKLIARHDIHFPTGSLNMALMELELRAKPQ